MYQVKDGKQVTPTCPECGCRLKNDEGWNTVWYHYWGDVEKDARGCICSLYKQEFIIDPKSGLDKGSIIVV